MSWAIPLAFALGIFVGALIAGSLHRLQTLASTGASP